MSTSRYLKSVAVRIRLLVLPFLLFPATPALALGECGLACCIGGASVSGVTLAENWGLSVQYEYMDMETIRHGSDAISPDEVINLFWMPGGSYAVPTKMTMEKLTFVAAKPLDERWQLLAFVPYVRNNMDMRRKMPSGMVMNMSMEEVSGLGDVSVMGLYTVYTDAPIRPTERLTVGVGIKAPTGENDVRMASGMLVHAMMQPGTGSWDAVFTLNYMRAWYPFILQVNGFYHYTTESDLGYEFGDQLGIDVIARFQTGSYTNVGLELSYIHAGQDEDHDGNYSRPMMSMLDNTSNTGVTAFYLAPSVQYKIPDSAGSLSLKYQFPVHQDVRGYQQVVDSRWMLSASMTW